MTAHRIETTVGSDKALTLDNLPFPAGTNVEVIVMEQITRCPDPDPYPLRGTVLRYDDPFEPAVPIEDWDCLA